MAVTKVTNDLHSLDIDSAEEVQARVSKFKQEHGYEDSDFDLRVTVGQEDQDGHTKELFVEVGVHGKNYWEFI
jgi:hypothetical protein